MRQALAHFLNNEITVKAVSDQLTTLGDAANEKSLCLMHEDQKLEEELGLCEIHPNKARPIQNRSNPLGGLKQSHQDIGTLKILYPSCAETPAVQGGDVERGERSSPKLNSVSAAARCTGG